MYEKLLEIIKTIRQFFLNFFNLNSKKKKSQTDLTSSESQSGAVELAIVNLAIGSATINIGEEATLKVTLTNNGDPVTLTKGDSDIKFNVPSFIDLAHVKIEDLPAQWVEGNKDPTQKSFTIISTSNATWAKGSTITFNLTNVNNGAGSEASTGNFTAFSADVLDYNTLSAPLILSVQEGVPPANLVDVLGVTLNNGGTIFVNDPTLLNQLTLNFKNLNSGRPIFNGTTWPANANPQVYISFIWGAGSGALTSLDTLNNQMISLAPDETTTKWQPGKGTDNNLPIWTLSPPKDPIGGKDSDILGTGEKANATFQFSDIAPIINGATQMYIQVTGFPYDDENLYNDFTFLVPINKSNPPVRGIPYFHAADASLNSTPGQPLFAHLFWQVFDIPQVQLTATALGLDWKSEVYTEVLVTDNHEVDLSQFYGAPSILFNLYGLNGSGNRINGIANQTIVEITYPPITVQKFEVSNNGNKLNPLIEIEIYPVQLIAAPGDPYVTLSLDGGKISILPNTGNDPDKFIYSGNYQDLFNEELITGEDYQFQLNLSGTFMSFNTKLFNYVPVDKGDFVFGGIVFWINPENNSHGLVCAISDLPHGKQWYNGENVNTGANGRAIGTGSSNTDKIVKVQGNTQTNYAAGLARAYNGGGFNDWFLPSINTLNTIYSNRNLINTVAKANGGGQFNMDTVYWSSSEGAGSNQYDQPDISAYGKYFSAGSNLAYMKYINYIVRPVRAF